MRISTAQQFTNSVNNMQRSQNELARLQEQISSGKRVNRPSDDPVAASQIVKLEREVAQFEKFELNINVTQRRLELQETILTDINTTVDRMRELTLQGATGTLSDADRKAVAVEIRQMAEYAASLMNTKDSQGEYIFSGSQGFTKPYVQDATGRYAYQGDGGQRSIQVSPELYLPSNDSGEYLFEAVSREIQVQRLNVAETDNTVTLLPFDSREAETRFAEAVKNRGDLRVEVYLQQDAVESYGVRLLDSDGQVLVDETIGDTDEFPYSFKFEGLEAEILQPPATDLTFTTQPEVMGIRAINLVDQAIAKTFAELYGDITIEFTKDPLPATDTGTYVLREFDSGELISIAGQTSFAYTDGQSITVGGYELQLGTPETGQEYTLEPSLSGAQLPPLSNVNQVVVADIANAQAFINANSPNSIEIEFNIDEVNSEVQVSVGGVLQTTVPYDATPTSLQVPTGSGIAIEFVPLNIKEGEKLTIPLLNQPQAVTELRVTDKQKNLLDIAIDLAELLEKPLTPATQKEFAEGVARALDDFQAAAGRNIESRTLIGSRLNALDSMADSNSEFKLFTQRALSAIKDLDYAEAISQFKLTELGLQAAQQTFARVQNLSLFDYLR